MKARIASIVVVLFMALVMIPIAWHSNTQAEAYDPAVNCSQVRIDKDTVQINCSIAGVAVAPIYVQLPTVPPVTVNVPVPGATQTIKVNIPGPTKTVTVAVTAPGATQTVHEPGPTKTVTVRPTPNSPSALPSSGGQSSSGSGTVETTVTATTTVTAEPSTGPNDPVISIPGVPDVVNKAALGLLSIIALVALMLVGMWLGYYIGYRDSDSANARFMRALRDELFVRKH